MKPFLIAALSLGLGLAAAEAQTPTPSPEPTDAPADMSKMTGKEVRAQCRDQAAAQGLEGEARKAAVQDCFAKARPDLAQRQKCREQGKSKGLADADLKAYVKTCVAGAQ